MAKAARDLPITVEKKTVHVLVLEHFHFPKEGTGDWSGDLVAATPQCAVGGTPENGDFLRVKAHRLAREHMEKFTGRGFEYEIREGRTSSPNEYRVWVETKDPNYDRFVWVVREIPFS